MGAVYGHVTWHLMSRATDEIHGCHCALNPAWVFTVIRSVWLLLRVVKAALAGRYKIQEDMVSRDRDG